MAAKQPFIIVGVHSDCIANENFKEPACNTSDKSQSEQFKDPSGMYKYHNNY